MFFRKYGLDDNTIDFIGHAVALHRDDSYLSEPAIDTVKRMKASLISKHKIFLGTFITRPVFEYRILVSPADNFTFGKISLGHHLWEPFSSEVLVYQL